MLSPVVIPLPAAIAVLAALGLAAWAVQRWLDDTPDVMWPAAPASAPSAPARHRLGKVASPYRPCAATARMDAVKVEIRATAWTPDELDAALDQAEKIRAEMLATEATWATGDTHELVAV